MLDFGARAYVDIPYLVLVLAAQAVLGVLALCGPDPEEHEDLSTPGEKMLRRFSASREVTSEPGRRSGSPCLDYYIKRCQAPCVGYISAEDYRAVIDSVIPLNFRFHNTDWVVAHFHTYLLLTVIFWAFARRDALPAIFL